MWQLATLSLPLAQAKWVPKYSPYDCELLTIYEAIKYYRHMVEARTFAIHTDHKPLTFAFKMNRDSYSPRQFRYLDFIGKFTTDLRYLPGSENVVADALSHVEEVLAAVHFEELARLQGTDPKLQGLLQLGSTLKLQKVASTYSNNVSAYCDTSTPTARPYITPALQRKAFDSPHIILGMQLQCDW